jgi:hypothetical protein
LNVKYGSEQTWHSCNSPPTPASLRFQIEAWHLGTDLWAEAIDEDAGELPPSPGRERSIPPAGDLAIGKAALAQVLAVAHR